MWADVKKINFKGPTSTRLQVEVDVKKKISILWLEIQDLIGLDMHIIFWNH